MTSTRSPCRQPESCSQLWIGNRIRSAVASPSPVSPLAGVFGGGASQFVHAGWKAAACAGAAADGGGEASSRVAPACAACGAAAGAGAGAAAASGSTCSTGPSAEPRTRSSGWSTETRVTCSPFSTVDDEPTFSNTHRPAPQRSTPCCRETNGTSVTRSLSGERPIRAVCPGRTVNSFPSRESRASPPTASAGAGAAGATQKLHPAGGCGQDGSGCHPGGGSHPAGGTGHPGGGLKTVPAPSDGGPKTAPKVSISAPDRG